MSFWKKLSYGIGDLGAGLVWGVVGSYLMTYLTDSIAMSAAALGTMMLVVRIFDGVSDAFMGTLIDKTNSKMGKARPWYIASIIPLCFTVYLCFNVPTNWSTSGQFVFLTVVYFLATVVFYTVLGVAYNALPALASDNTKDRVGMSVIRTICSLTVSIIAGIIIMPMIEARGGIYDPKAWSKVITIIVFVSLFPLLISSIFTKELPQQKSKAAEEAIRLPFWKGFWYAFSNKYFLLMLVATFATYIRIALLGASTYYAIYVVGDPNQVGIITIATLLPMILGMAYGVPLVNKVGIQKGRSIGFIISIVGAAISAVFSNNFTLVLIGIFITGMGLGPASPTTSALLAYIADYGEWQHGVKLQGVTFSCNSVAVKVATGFGSAILGWCLAAGGYIEGSAIQPVSAITMIKFVFLYMPLILCVLTYISNLFLDIEKKMPDIYKELEERNNVEIADA